eukprot:GHVT01074701.1.p1 GENE.GHVT01074701.1~~GHVT01074701.1.p1  ORF type:complete len:395 (-),score=10.17 GHVT01074701.1:728-1912(-)
MSLCNHWNTDPFDVAVVNRLLFEDIHLVDKDHKTFKSHCATRMSQKEVNILCRDALSVGVELTRYETYGDECEFDNVMQEKIKCMDIVIAHFPQTHNELLNCGRSIRDDAHRIFFIHSMDDTREFEEFAEKLAGSDYVYFLNEKVQTECKRKNTLPSLNHYPRVYLVSCPLKLIPVAEALEQPDSPITSDSDSDSDTSSDSETNSVSGSTSHSAPPSISMITYCSALSHDPRKQYHLKSMTKDIKNFKDDAVWRIVASKDPESIKAMVAKDAKSITVECHMPTSLVAFFKQIVSKSTYWAVPKVSSKLTSRLDLLFAVGSGKPILTNEKNEKLLAALQEFTNITAKDKLEFGDLSKPIDHEQLASKARELLKKYLLDTKSAASSREFIQRILGN